MSEILLVADYHALEVVILADLCKRLFGDTQLEAMVAPDAPDIHVFNARSVFGHHLGWTVPVGFQYAGRRVDEIPPEEFKAHPHGAKLREMLKTIWYGLSYGKGAYGFSTLRGADDLPIGEETAQRMLDGLAKATPGPFKWQAWARKYVNRYRGIYSLGGRWCPLYNETEPDAPDWMRQRAYRRAYNFPMQATGAEIIGDAMVRVGNCPQLKAYGFRTCLNIHDELVMRGPLTNIELAKERLIHHMTSATANGTRLLVPLQVSSGHGTNYWEAK